MSVQDEARLRLVLLEMERHLHPSWTLHGVVDEYSQTYVVYLSSRIARVPSKTADGRTKIVDVGHCTGTDGKLPFSADAEALWRDLCPGPFWDAEDEDDVIGGGQ